MDTNIVLLVIVSALAGAVGMALVIWSVYGMIVRQRAMAEQLKDLKDLKGKMAAIEDDERRRDQLIKEALNRAPRFAPRTNLDKEFLEELALRIVEINADAEQYVAKGETLLAMIQASRESKPNGRKEAATK